MKTYRFFYEDKDGNEIKKELVEADNLKDAKRMAKIALVRSKLNDLQRIRVKI